MALLITRLRSFSILCAALVWIAFSGGPILSAEFSWSWDVSGDLLGWEAVNFESTMVKDGQLRGTTRYDAQLISPLLSLEAGERRFLEFRLKSDTGGGGELFFRDQSEGFSGERQISFSILGDGQFHTYRVDLSAYAGWKGHVAQVRFDPLNPAGAKIALRGLRFVASESGNLVENGNFEWSDTAGGTPSAWIFEGLTLVLIAREESGHALRATGIAKGASIRSAMFELPETGAHRLALEWSGDVMPQVTVEIFNVFHESIGKHELKLSELITKDWHRAEAKLEVEPLAAYAQISLPVEMGRTLELISVSLLAEARPDAIAASATTSTSAPEVKAVPTFTALPKPAVCRLKYLPGRIPSLEIDGETVSPMHVLTMRTTAEMDERILENTRNAGIEVLWLNLPQGFAWKPDAAPDFSELDLRLAEVAAVHPEARIVLNVPLDPVYNPGMREWLNLYPDELARKDDGDTNVGGYRGSKIRAPSYASEVWLRDAGEAWRALIRHVRTGPHAGRVIGYVPISGISWEWFYWGSQSKDFLDYSAPFVRAFRSWLRQIYDGKIEALNRAWNRHYSSFDEITVPTRAERDNANPHLFLDPKTQGAVIDLHAFIAHLVSDDVLHFCRIVKEETQGESICGTYYGYVMYIGYAYFGVHSGHFALQKVLESPEIDFLMSPSRYGYRSLGDGTGFMTTVDACKLHGKLYIDQIDIRTFRGTGPSGQISRIPSLAGSVEVLRREFANCLVNGVAPQWYDFGNGWITGDQRLMQAVGQMKKIESELLHAPRQAVDPQHSIAVVVSETSILHCKVNSPIQNAAVNNQINPLNGMGIAWDAYLAGDLESIPDYPCYLFLNCFDLTAQQKRFIEEKLKRSGKVLVWIYAPGILEPVQGRPRAETSLDATRIAEVTGFDVRPVEDGSLLVQMDGAAKPLGTGMKAAGVVMNYGDSHVVTPRFGVFNGDVQGVYVENGGGALSVKKFSDWTSIYSAAPTLSSGLLREIARLAKVPVVNEQEKDVTYVSGNLFAVHSLSGGERSFFVGKDCLKVKELFSRSEYAVKDGRFKAVLEPGGTTLFLIER